MLKRLVIAACLAGLLVPAAQAADLWQVWQLATQNDPAFKQAKANRNASMQAKPLAWSQLFPSIDLTASRQWQNNTRSSQSVQAFGSQPISVNSSGASNVRSDSWGATLTQTLFNWQQFMAIKGGDLTVAQAQADYQSALQGLMVSVSQAYFDVLNQKDVLAADTANQKALHRQLDQAQQQYKVGMIAVTGVRQAEAAYEQARAQVIVDRQLLSQAREALRAITGRYLPHLQSPENELPLAPPQPSSVQAWVRTGIEENPSLASAKLSQKIADNQVSQQRGGYMPSLNLQLSHTYGHTDGNSSSCSISGGSRNCVPAQPNLGRQYGNTIGLSLNWNIYQGGGTRAVVKQAQYQADAAMAAQIAQRRTVEQNVRNAYLAVLSGIAQVKATRQAVTASRVSLEATVQGRKAGTQTTLDVLTSRKNLLDSQKSFFNARYTYLVAVLQLEQAAGSLTPDDIKRLNGWLTATGAPASSSVLAPVSATAMAMGH